MHILGPDIALKCSALVSLIKTLINKVFFKIFLSHGTQDNALEGVEEEKIKCMRKTRDSNQHQTGIYSWRAQEKNRIIDRCRDSFIVAICK